MRHSFCISELKEYWLKRSPSIFQQTRSNNLCASLIHKNDIDCFQIGDVSDQTNSEEQPQLRSTLGEHFNFNRLLELRQRPKGNRNSAGKNVSEPSDGLRSDHLRNIKSIQQLTLNNVEIANENDIVVMPEISESDTLRFEIEKLKETIEQHLVNRQQLQISINECRDEKSKETEIIKKLKSEKKIKERTHLLLENPEVNLSKMKTVLATTQERINKLKAQWEEHRAPLVEQLEKARQSSTKQYVSFNVISISTVCV